MVIFATIGLVLDISLGIKDLVKSKVSLCEDLCALYFILRGTFTVYEFFSHPSFGRFVFVKFN